jgi:hypothetical protein
VLRNEPTTINAMKSLSIAASLLLAGLCTVQAQRADRTAPSDDFDPAEARINLEIDSIPIGELPAVLNKALGRQINLIVPPDAGHITLPPLKLHQITVPELFEALQVASSPAGVIEPLYTFQVAAGNVWIFKVLQPAAPAPSPAGTASQVFALEPFLRNLKVEDITTAIQTVASMSAGPEARPSLKYHEETKLLIAAGSPTVLKSIESVLAALSTSVQSQKEKAVAGELEAARGEMQSQKLASGLRIEALEHENANLHERLKALEAKSAELDRELVRVRAERELADRERDRVRAELDQAVENAKN